MGTQLRRRLSPPRRAGWKPVNSFARGYLQSQEESSLASTCPQVGATVSEGFEATFPTGDKGTV